MTSASGHVPGKAVAIAAFSTTERVEMEYSAAQFKVYEDYLDSKVTPMDLFYLKVSPAGSHW